MCRLNLERFTKIQGIVIIASYSRQLFADIKMKNYKFKPVLLSPGEGAKYRANKTDIIL